MVSSLPVVVSELPELGSSLATVGSDLPKVVSSTGDAGQFRWRRWSVSLPVVGNWLAVCSVPLLECQ